MTTVVPSGKARLRVEGGGSGVPVVFLHAGVADRRMWRDQLDEFALHAVQFRTLAYDRRGFGETPHADEPYSHVGDLFAMLDTVAAGEPAILVGCSQGGRIAIDAAVAEPGRVRALVLVAPAISGAPAVDSFPAAIVALLEALERAETAGDVDGINALEAHAWLDGPAVTEGRVAGPARELFLAMNGIALRAVPRGREIEPKPAYARLRQIAVPTLVMWGELDFPHLVARCEHLAAHVPRAQTHVFRNAAHLPNLEYPDAFNRALVGFCEAVAR